LNESLTGLERHFFGELSILISCPNFQDEDLLGKMQAMQEQNQYFIFILFFYLWEAFEG